MISDILVYSLVGTILLPLIVFIMSCIAVLIP